MTTVEEYFKNKDADFFNNREKLLEGIDFCNKQLINNPNDAITYHWLGFCYSCLNLNLEKAIYNFNKAIELNPYNSQSYLMRGNCYRTLTQYKSAIIDFKKSIDIENQNPTHSSMISGLKFNLTGVLVEIREICDEHYDTAGDYMREYDWDSAIDELTAAIEEYSAIELIKNEDYFEEIENESRGWKGSIFQDIALTFDVRASCYEELKEYESALSDTNEAVRICPNRKRKGYFHINRAQVYRKMGNYEKAIEDLSIAIKFCSNDNNEINWFENKDLITAYANRAYCYMEFNEYKKAIEDYSELIELEPENIRNYGARAKCYQILKQYGKAIEGYSKVIDLCDGDGEYCFDAYRDRIDCYVDIKDYKSAKSDCEYLLEHKDLFYTYAEDDFFRKMKIFCNQLEQLTGNDEYEESEYEEDEYEIDSKECAEHLRNFSNYYFQEQPQKAITELSKAYAIDSAAVIYTLDLISKKVDDTRFLNFQVSAIKLFMDMEEQGMSKDEIVQYMEEKSKIYETNIDISALHKDPTQGRKLDL